MNHYSALSITPSIICVGCLSVDVIHLLEDLPKEGEEVTCLQAHWRRGGHASNVSYALRMLGAQVVFLGMLSRSNLLIDFLQKMRATNITLDYCPKTDEPPAFTMITEAKNGGRSILSCNKRFPYVTAQDFKAIDLDQCGWAHFEGRYLHQTIQMMRVVGDYNNGRDRRMPISIRVNSNYMQIREAFILCDYVIISGRLAQQLGWNSPEEACRNLDKDLEMPRNIKVRRPCIVCTWGQRGAGCLSAEGVYEEVSAPKNRRIKETYGAGECFTAAFIYGIYMRQMSLRNAVELANRVTSHKISAHGYSHLANISTYPEKTVAEDSRPNSEDSEVGDILCRKYLRRQVNYSDGKAATRLLGLYDEETVDKVDVKDKEDEAEAK